MQFTNIPPPKPLAPRLKPANHTTKPRAQRNPSPTNQQQYHTLLSLTPEPKEQYHYPHPPSQQSLFIATQSLCTPSSPTPTSLQQGPQTIHNPSTSTTHHKGSNPTNSTTTYPPNYPKLTNPSTKSINPPPKTNKPCP